MLELREIPEGIWEHPQFLAVRQFNMLELG